MTEKSVLLWGPCNLLVQDTDQMALEKRIQVSAHRVQSKSFLRELKEVFPAQQDMIEATVIATMQHAVMDLVRVGMEVEKEKDHLLEVFVSFAKNICEEIRQLGYWSDYIDPCSGLPMLSEGCNIVYNEVQSAQILLNYSIMNAGCCKVLLHPIWGSAVYPASIITTAPADALLLILNKARRKEGTGDAEEREGKTD